MAPLAHPSALAAQTPPGGPPQVASHLVQAWVWPAWGDDATGAINDSSQPYKSIQAAIDALNGHILADGAPVKEGLVWCMPGLYGPTEALSHGPSASGDTFPIQMKHRVHVRGVSARRCVIRGVHSTDPAIDANDNWSVYAGEAPMSCPTTATSTPLPRQVLVTFRNATKYAYPGGTEPHWWAGFPEVHEVLDGFTFQGGEVQVSFDEDGVFAHTYPQSGRVSNCIFDMRDTASIEGPLVGLLMSMRYESVNVFCGAYFDQKVHVANNTFIMAEYGSEGWTNDARDGAVGVVNVSDQNYNGPITDPNKRHRGLGNPGLQNNIFRIKPANVATNTGVMAMIGIDSSDCMVRDADAGGSFLPTNAFAPTRVGFASSLLLSTPVQPVIVSVENPSGGWFSNDEPLYYDLGLNHDCSQGAYCSSTAVALPTPAVALWNGSPSPINEHDPGFVGEFLINQPGTPVAGDYADWRLLPGSPLIDQGRLWERNEFANGSIFEDHPHELLSLNRWDGEGWGNVRVHGAQVDIGFDEFHLGLMAGSYANGSNSHNKTTFLNPSATASQSERRILLPTVAAGSTVIGSTLRVKAIERQIGLPIPPWTMPAWSAQPLLLESPLVNGTLPVGYQTAYINFAAERWTVGITGLMVLTTAPAVQVPGSSPWSVVQVELPPDDEGANYTSHFNSQFVLDGGAFATELRGNLQPEYR